MPFGQKVQHRLDRRSFIGGSDARIIMGNDEAALLRLWREKRGDVEPEDLSGNLIVQLGLATEELNRRWAEANTVQVLTHVQQQFQHLTLRWRFSSRNSCCLGHSRKRPRPRNPCRSCNTICGW